MIATEFFFIADRGALKVYRLSTSSTPTLRLAETIEIDAARKRLSEEVTDQAGAFPKRGVNGHAHSNGEAHNLKLETEHRSVREIASKIADVLRRNPPQRWSLAAPEEINKAIVNTLPADLQRRLVNNLKKDLVNAPHQEVLRHFKKAA